MPFTDFQLVDCNLKYGRYIEKLKLVVQGVHVHAGVQFAVLKTLLKEGNFRKLYTATVCS